MSNILKGRGDWNNSLHPLITRITRSWELFLVERFYFNTAISEKMGFVCDILKGRSNEIKSWRMCSFRFCNTIKQT